MPETNKFFSKFGQSDDKNKDNNKLFEKIDSQLSAASSKKGGPNDYNLEEVNILLGLSNSDKDKIKKPDRPKVMKNSQMNSDGTVTLPDNPVKPPVKPADNNSAKSPETQEKDKSAEKNTASDIKSSDMTEEEINSVSEKINKKYMQKLLLEIAGNDPYNITGNIMCIEFPDIIKALKTVLKNAGKDFSVLENADFKFFASFVDAIISESYESFFRHYGKVDFSEKFEKLEEIKFFITESLKEHYAAVVIEYNKSAKEPLNKFFAPVNPNHKIEKCIDNNILWYVYTIDRENVKSFKVDTGVGNAVVRDKSRRTLWIYNALAESPWNNKNDLPDRFNIYKNRKLPEYQSLSFLIKILYHNDADFYFSDNSSENNYEPQFKAFIRDIIDSFMHIDSAYEKNAPEIVIPDSLFNVISRYVSNVNFRKKPSFDHVTTSIFRTYIDTYDDEDFLLCLNDNDCLSDEILNLMSDVVKDTSLLPVHNAIVNCLVNHLAYMCKSSNETSADMISYMLTMLPVYDIYEMSLDTDADYAEILEKAVEKLKADTSADF